MRDPAQPVRIGSSQSLAIISPTKGTDPSLGPLGQPTLAFPPLALSLRYRLDG